MSKFLQQHWFHLEQQLLTFDFEVVNDVFVNQDCLSNHEVIVSPILQKCLVSQSGLYENYINIYVSRSGIHTDDSETNYRLIFQNYQQYNVGGCTYERWKSIPFTEDLEIDDVIQTMFQIIPSHSIADLNLTSEADKRLQQFIW